MPYSVLNMETVGFSKTLVTTYQSTCQTQCIFTAVKMSDGYIQKPGAGITETILTGL